MIDCPKKCISTIKAETENAQYNHNDHTETERKMKLSDYKLMISYEIDHAK